MVSGGDIMRKVKVFCLITAFAMLAAAGCKEKKAEGDACKSHDDCKEGLKCVNSTCLDISGDSPVCKWSLQCLRKLGEKADIPEEDRVQAAKWYKKLSQLPLKEDCKVMATKFIPGGLKPYVWKPVCNAPPVEGIKQNTDSSNPFKVTDFKISGSWVPPDDMFHEERTGPGHFKDQCKAWVEFEVNRRFQGRVVAQFYKEYDCKEVEEKVDGRKVKKDVCKTKPYKRTDSHYYLYLTEPGTKKAINFFVETPPEVCKGRVEKHYPTGCYCKGLSKDKIKLLAQEDDFLTPMDIQLAKESKKKKK
jgi:hypothetical protein